MSAFRYGVAVAAISSGFFVVQAGAQQATPPVAVPPHQPSTTRPVTISEQGQQSSWDRMGMRGFSVALVVGDLAGVATADNLPAGAKKALSDMRDFLPYKSYRLLDTHWILCCSSRSQATVSGRLKGAEEDEYSFSIDVRPVNDWSELGITFSLRDSGGSADQATQAITSVLSSYDRSRMMAELVRERTDLRSRAEEAATKYGERHPARMKLQVELENNALRIRELEQGALTTRTSSRGRDTRPVLDSTFSMKVGETVVIGTSRLKGDKALIALLTAASRTAPSAR